MRWFALWPLPVDGLMANRGAQFYPWQLFTYGFLHGGSPWASLNLLHVFLNMFGLWMFGSNLEFIWGRLRFLLYYFVCLVGAGLIQLVITTIAVRDGGFPAPTVGASGAVFGLLLAIGVVFPNERLSIFFTPLSLRAKYWVVGYGLLELTLGVTSTQSMVAHFAHLGGMIFGFFLIWYWRSQPYWHNGYMNRDAILAAMAAEAERNQDEGR
ncbi:MAG: rhomboid family intramembrane serine protease [Gammaproteobacteria bacterium]|nr:rhomboid family intramembrane serine protease [Gammaproteobacteria bacterium]NND61500.1 rhomboid family intramembrane serine protease [Gammaproteobacteria bacterium]